MSFSVVDPWIENGFATLVCDKRGVGLSSGECCPAFDEGYFPLLATDLITGIAAITQRSEVDFYADNDLSVPVKQSIEVLEATQASYGTDFTIEVHANTNHSMIVDGGICQQTGQPVDYFTPIFNWLASVLP